jgi:ribosomal protein S18 acetylase RimI-like enzyme
MPTIDHYTLRAATNADAPQIWGLISRVLLSYGITPDAATTDRDLADLAASYPPGTFFVLLDGAQIIGTVALRPDAEARWELCRMYLDAQYRRQGLGRRLLAHALREARRRGCAELYLKTASVLTEAISLYRHAGFHTVAGAPVGGNCDTVMRLSLRPICPGAPGPRP